MSQQNELRKIVPGILLLIFMQVLAIIVICIIAYFVNEAYPGYAALGVLAIGIYGLFLWQLLYVIPVCIWLRRKRKPLMMKGVIIGAVITALINGGCFLMFLR